MTDLQKTDGMKRIELEDAIRRSAPRRDIRDILAEMFLLVDSCSVLAGQVDVSPATLSTWLSGPLKGKVVGVGVHRRLIFEDFETEVDRRDQCSHEDQIPALAAGR